MNSEQPQKNRLLRLLDWIRPTAYGTPYRYEKKFIIPIQKIQHLEMLLYRKGCSTLFPSRWINNLYCDTYQGQSLNENIEGFSDRIKNRFRWYGDTFGIINVTAEQKIKCDDVNRKNSVKLGEFEFYNLQEVPKLFESFKLKLHHMPNETNFLSIEMQEPNLINRYQRKYLANLNGDIRITLDTDLSYYNIRTGLQSKQKYYCIVELKCSSNSPIIEDLLPLQLSKSSKFVEGMLTTDPKESTELY